MSVPLIWTTDVFQFQRYNALLLSTCKAGVVTQELGEILCTVVQYSAVLSVVLMSNTGSTHCTSSTGGQFKKKQCSSNNRYRIDSDDSEFKNIPGES